MVRYVSGHAVLVSEAFTSVAGCIRVESAITPSIPWPPSASTLVELSSSFKPHPKRG